MTQVLKFVYKSKPCDDVDLFFSKVNIGRQCIERVKLLKCLLKGKSCRKSANGQDIDYSEKYGPRASSAPLLGLFSIIFKHAYWYIQQISGERLQDHWSSGYLFIFFFFVFQKQFEIRQQVSFDDQQSPEELAKKSFTLKQLIRKLHITEPVEHVMCLIGKK